ncbi:MAG: hypothetical protein IPH31_23285 [Lewinellaceae bacterium]|nr:hypothetical protein [Lewinellaceae bacterium]
MAIKETAGKVKDLLGLESAFGLAQRRDSAELALLGEVALSENWPRINKIHRQIQARQQKLSAHGSFKSKKGFVPTFTQIKTIDSLEADSRRLAAAYLYNHAQGLLAITDSTGQRQPAGDAYRALLELKDNYFPSWENANALIDSAYQNGKAHILFETSVLNGVPDGKAFWRDTHLGESRVKSEWLVFYTDSTARSNFDFRAKCRLVSLYVSPESNTSTERTECTQVEDGYDEKLDTAGRVISRTLKYKTETKTITTYSASRSANGTVLLQLVDEHTGKTLHEQAIDGHHNSSDSSEMFMVSAPSEMFMIGYVASSIQGSIHWHLRKMFVAK